MKYRNFSITNVGKVRSANEDNYGEANTPNGKLFVVCDGMGGHVGGAMASSIAVKSIVEYFQREAHSNIIQAIDRAFSFANEQIFAHSLNNPELKGMGTTAVVLLISNDDCFIGHVGDSRIYLKSDNKLYRITKDHSFVQTLVDSGVISDEEAESHPNKNQILKALGISSVVEGTICQYPIQTKAGDVFLLCSDGLNGMVNDRGLEMMLQGNNLSQSGEDLIRAALDAGGHDNITATLVAIDESKYKTSTFRDFNPVKKFDGSSTQTILTHNSKPKPFKLFSLKGILGLSILGLFIGSIAIFLINYKPNKISLNTNKKESDSLITSVPKDTSTNNIQTTVTNTNKVNIKKDNRVKKDNKVNKDSTSNLSKATLKYHIVEKNQTINDVLRICNNYCSSLTVEKIIAENKHLKTDIQNQLQEETPITPQTKLKIPCHN